MEEQKEEVRKVKRPKNYSKWFYNDEIIHFNKETNTVTLKEGVKRRYKRTREEFEDLWFGVSNEHINEEALFYDKVVRARKIIDEERYWNNDEFENN